jgi:hypothetical protein
VAAASPLFTSLLEATDLAGGRLITIANALQWQRYHAQARLISVFGALRYFGAILPAPECLMATTCSGTSQSTELVGWIGSTVRGDGWQHHLNCG